MAKKKAKCSEMAQNLHDIAMIIGTEPGVKDLDGVLDRMQQHFPAIRRDDLADAIVEATEGQASQADALRDKLNEIKREARSDRALRDKITDLQQALKAGEVPRPTRRAKQPTEPIKQLREIRDGLKKQIAQSDPARKQRLESQITDLERVLESGDIRPSQPRVEVRESRDLERLQFQRDRLRGQIQNRIRALKPRTMFDRIADPFNGARALMTSFDFSGFIRQGGFIVVSHPIRGLKALPDMFLAFASAQKAAKAHADIMNSADAPLLVKSGLFIAPVDGSTSLSKREEAYMTTWIDKLQESEVGRAIAFPVVGSSRAYVTVLNKLRVDAFRAMAAGLGRNGEVTIEEAKAIANFVNVATGRGKLGSLEQNAVALNTAFFAPRYVVSRFQLIAGQPFYGGNARTRKAIALEYARYLGGMGIIYALASAAGGELEEDPTSSNFGKIRIGNTRIDPLSGISQVMVLGGRVAKGETKSSITEAKKPIRGKDVPFGGDNTFDVMTRFGRTKLSPMFGTAIDVAVGENVVGETVTAESAIKNLLIPLSFKEIGDTIEEQGVSRGTALGLLSIFGAGIQTYGKHVDTLSEAEYQALLSKYTTKRGHPHKGREELVKAIREARKKK